MWQEKYENKDAAFIKYHSCFIVWLFIRFSFFGIKNLEKDIVSLLFSCTFALTQNFWPDGLNATTFFYLYAKY